MNTCLAVILEAVIFICVKTHLLTYVLLLGAIHLFLKSLACKESEACAGICALKRSSIFIDSAIAQECRVC